ncbi:MAG: HAD family phosphatase [Candidatus Aenigmarchaeota archaeon]|nr:HAD family phosphatase [Candidatus Aenigmarchaeota archaeon]
MKAVIFDWGGVLIDDPASRMHGYFSSYFGVPVQEFEKTRKKFEDDFQKGIISEGIFWELVCKELGVQKPKTLLWGRAFKATYSPIKEMFALVSDLRNKGYKTGLLSNTEEPSVTFFEENKNEYGMFDAAVFSCREGTAKPEKKIYEIVLKRLGVNTGDAVFIDNKLEFVDGAKRVGMKAVLFKNFEQLKKELDSLIDLSGL